MKVLKIILTPRDFMNEIVDKSPRLAIPFRIVLMAMVLFILAQSIFAIKLSNEITEKLVKVSKENITEEQKSEFKNSLRMGMLFSSATGCVGMIIFWLIGCGILTMLSILLDGQCNYKKLVEMTGYSYIAMILFGILSLIFNVFFSVSINEEILKLPFGELTNAIKTELMSLSHWKFFLSLRGCAIFWIIILWVLAFKLTSRLNYFKSTLCVIGLGTLYVIASYISESKLLRM